MLEYKEAMKVDDTIGSDIYVEKDWDFIWKWSQ